MNYSELVGTTYSEFERQQSEDFAKGFWRSGTTRLISEGDSRKLAHQLKAVLHNEEIFLDSQ